MRKKVWGAVIGLLVVAALAAGFWLLYDNLRGKPVEGSKTLTVKIIKGDSVKTVKIDTQAGYLRGALEEKGLIAGEESVYGLFIKTVDGYTANEANQEWWCITKGGQTVNTGVDFTPIADGETYELTLKIGYDW